MGQLQAENGQTAVEKSKASMKYGASKMIPLYLQQLLAFECYDAQLTHRSATYKLDYACKM